MMYLLFTVIVLVAVTYWLTNSNNSNDKIDINNDDVYESPIEGTFDISYFITSGGKFKFPYYETDDNALVHIKDNSDYDGLRKELMDNGEIQDGRIDELPFDVFNMYIGNYLDFDVEEFWRFMDGLNEDDLQAYPFLYNHVDDLGNMLYKLDDEINDHNDHIFFLKDDFMKELYANGLFDVCDDLEDDELYEVYLRSLGWYEIKKLAEKYDIDSSINIFELIKKLVDKISNESIPAPVVVNDKFYEMVQYLYVKYFASIQDEIDDWHPVYIKVVWECVEGMVDYIGLESLKAMYDKVVETEYWKNRIKLNRI